MKAFPLVALCIWHFCATLLHAQSSTGIDHNNAVGSAEALPEAPLSFILDEAGIFSRDAAQKEKVSSQLQDLNDQYNFPIYLVTSESFLTTSVQEAAQKHYEAWFPKAGDGIVIYYDRDSAQFGDGRRFQEIGENSDKINQVSKIPDYVVQAIFSDLKALYSEKLQTKGSEKTETKTSAESVEDFINDLTTIAKEKLSNQVASTQESKGFNYFWLLLPLALLGCALFWGLQYRSQRNAISSREEFWFPKVLIGTRLGARFGGGKSSEISFGEDA